MRGAERAREAFFLVGQCTGFACANACVCCGVNRRRSAAAQSTRLPRCKSSTSVRFEDYISHYKVIVLKDSRATSLVTL
jgi:hypothetical protein